MNMDDLWPRDDEHRYRLYVVRGDEHDVLAASPTMEGIGLAIRTIHDDCKEAGLRFADLGIPGILDTLGRADGDYYTTSGEWLILPWIRGQA